ncbi:MAG: NHL repeat-containing protein [Chitinophagales bacterium]
MKKSFPIFLVAVTLINACHNKNSYPVVTTFAGSGAMGSIDGKGTAASFSNLMGITTDAQGNIYVADSHNNLIRKISPDGIVKTFAGSGAVGSTDGPGIAASFFNPGGVAADKNGNVYVADTHNSLIRKISPDGIVTTIAGKRENSFIRGDSSARFDNPSGIAVDVNGNVYVADWANNLIRKISPAGKVTNLAGSGLPGSKDGIGSSASFYLPWGIAVDTANNVYVADSYNNMIRKINPAGVVTTLAGKKAKGSANGIGAEASFFHPAGIALDKQDNVYVADMGNNKIRRISPDGIVTTLAGSGERGASNGRDTNASFYKPYGVAVDRDGNVYVADYQNNLVRKISF